MADDQTHAPDAAPDDLTVEEFLDGFALWQEHAPQSAEDWAAVAKRCAADPTFDYTKSSPLFGAAFLLARELKEVESNG